MSKKILFHSDATDFDIMPPVPASKMVPAWYRKMSGVNDGVMSVKKCVPFLDSITSGYIVPLPADVKWNEAKKYFSSDSIIKNTSMHEPSQVLGVDIPEEYDPTPHKWESRWFVKTPKGYSTLFVHPLNRPDLPFYSFSGIVDTDKHPLIINFPFVLKKNFEGTIPAGTPMIQAIPFKRDKWSAKIVDQGEGYFYPYTYKVSEPPFGYYKRNFWSRKEFR
jgi:hypothetical protein